MFGRRFVLKAERSTSGERYGRKRGISADLYGAR